MATVNKIKSNQRQLKESPANKIENTKANLFSLVIELEGANGRPWQTHLQHLRLVIASTQQQPCPVLLLLPQQTARLSDGDLLNIDRRRRRHSQETRWCILAEILSGIPQQQFLRRRWRDDPNAAMLLSMIPAPSMSARRAPPKSADLPEARRPCRTVSRPPVAAPAAMEFQFPGVLLRTVVDEGSVEGEEEAPPPQTAKLPPTRGAGMRADVAPPASGEAVAVEL